MRDEIGTEMLYKVVSNAEKQFSIWPAYKQNAIGWQDVGYEGRKEVCLAFINNMWKDMRPHSLIESMNAESGLQLRTHH
ncbi:MAG TPA: MbtH family NRPS accessory protein [Burkholderiaceae bacterium]|jgi:MbtH protein